MTATLDHVDAPHALDPADVLAALEVDPGSGLDPEEVRRRRDRVGRNELGARRSRPWWSLLWAQLSNLVSALLAAAAVGGLLVGEVVEAAAIVVVLVVNTVVGFVTELRAQQSMAALRTLMRTVADVHRAGSRDEVDAADLVPGDIVSVEAGEQVPADIRLVEAEDLRTQEAGLTGESDAVGKSVDPVAPDAGLAERSCMLFAGTTVLSGRSRGVVVATGSGTEMGLVAALAEDTDAPKAPLQEGLDQLSRRLALVVVVGAAALLGIGLLRGRDVEEVVEIAVALAIAVVPEGLPAVATLTLAVGMRRMAAGHALVRRLPAVQTLGSTTVVCSDKTGTLTRNEMVVDDLHVAPGHDEDDVWRVAVLCNDADQDDDGEPIGDPTETALLAAAQRAGVDWRRLRHAAERDREVPFDPQARRMAVVSGGVVHVKGAPDVLLHRDRDAALVESADRMAGRGLRTLALASGPAPAEDAGDEQLFADLEAVGVVGMQDPPRESAVAALETLHAAGIRTVMITGDRPDTAEVIADDMDLGHDGVMTGSTLAGLSESQLRDTVASTDVFARGEPKQKVRIIEALRDAGEVVAVTGDGVNDAPALSRADVGIAMGSGTDVAKEAADIVLLDDEFSTIETAVEEGRRIFTNIRRFAQFLFSWHVAEVTVITAALLAGLPPPLAGLMILWNNLVIDVIPSFALALEPSRGDVMRDKPRDPSEPVISRPVVRRILAQAALVATVGLAAFAVARLSLALDTPGAQTMTFVAMSVGQVLAVFNARTDRGSGFRGALSNRWLWLALAVTTALEVVALTVAPLSSVLGLTGLPATGWVTAVMLGLIPVVVTQAYRVMRRGHEGRPPGG
jgi:P-type Ca2+ transporter type 2C